MIKRESDDESRVSSGGRFVSHDDSSSFPDSQASSFIPYQSSVRYPYPSPQSLSCRRKCSRERISFIEFASPSNSRRHRTVLTSVQSFAVAIILQAVASSVCVCTPSARVLIWTGKRMMFSPASEVQMEERRSSGNRHKAWKSRDGTLAPSSRHAIPPPTPPSIVLKLLHIKLKEVQAVGMGIAIRIYCRAISCSRAREILTGLGSVSERR